jgi:hypothetical protein
MTKIPNVPTNPSKVMTFEVHRDYSQNRGFLVNVKCFGCTNPNHYFLYQSQNGKFLIPAMELRQVATAPTKPFPDKNWAEIWSIYEADIQKYKIDFPYTWIDPKK